MTSISASNSNNSILSQYAIGNQTAVSGANASSSASNAAQAVASATQSLGENDFLTMMMAQLKNQDPLNPMDNTQFVAQLAQFSQVQGIQNMNTTMTSLSQSMTSNQALQASSLIGKQVYVPSASTSYSGQGGLTGQYVLPQASSGVDVTISDSSGSVIKNIPLGSQAAGTNNFSWDGTNNQGVAVPAGTYSVAVSAPVGGKTTQLSTNLPASVNSVSFSGSGGAVQLNLQGMGSVPLTSVTQIAQ